MSCLWWFLTATLHRGLRNDFFFHYVHFFLPSFIWTFISLFSLDFYFPFIFGLLFSLFFLDFYSIVVTFWIYSNQTFIVIENLWLILYKRFTRCEIGRIQHFLCLNNNSIVESFGTTEKTQKLCQDCSQRSLKINESNNPCNPCCGKWLAFSRLLTWLHARLHFGYGVYSLMGQN